MSLDPGTRLGPYEIGSPIGAGGMGEVYRARDTKLDREVAIKVLPEEFASDAERLARFQREAKIVASLNHPNIAGIYGLEDHDGIRALALELVEGPTLAERIAQGPIAVERALAIAKPIAAALEAAHEKGIVHRDLKPGNVILPAEPEVKVLDFGLAKAMEDPPEPAADLTSSPTLSMRATRAGIILGTAAYMSPEQARGELVDTQADVWAFGVVLFEMLTGRRPFQGDTASDVLASVLKEEPDWALLPPESPRAVRRLLRRCLAKDRRERLRHIGDAALELVDIEPDEVAPKPVASRSWLAAAGAALAALSAVSALTVSHLLSPTPNQLEVRRMAIPVERTLTVTARPLLSPDGKKVVYYAEDTLWVHYLDQFDPRRIEGTSNAQGPLFAPDSERLAFVDTSGNMFQIRLDGSDRRLICQLPAQSYGVSGIWRDDGTIVFSTWAGGLFEVPSQGGEPATLPGPDYWGVNNLTHVFPESGALLYSRYGRGIDLWSDGRSTTLLPGEDIVDATFSKTGHLLYHRADDGLWAVPFSSIDEEITGGPFQIDPIGGLPSLSDEGRLLYARGRDRAELVRVARDGTVLETIGAPRFLLQDPAVSPNGRWVAAYSREQGQPAIWIHDAESGASRRLTFETEPASRTPAWAGSNELFYDTREGVVWRQSAEGGGKPIRVVEGANPHVSSDGQTVVFTDRSRTAPNAASGAVNIFHLDWRQDSEPTVFVKGEFRRFHPRLSPDGNWLAYSSDEVGGEEVFVRRFPSGDGPWQISTNGGSNPRWSPAGDELFFVSGRAIMSAKIRTGNGLDSDRPERVLTLLGPSYYEYAVSPDGESFILVDPSAGIDELAIVDNWFSELERLVPTQ